MYRASSTLKADCSVIFATAPHALAARCMHLRDAPHKAHQLGAWEGGCGLALGRAIIIHPHLISHVHVTIVCPGQGLYK